MATIPAVDGWFTTDADRPALLGSRCPGCGTYAFPAERFLCRNPACDRREFEQVELSRRGTVWSYTNACYQPPDPYVPVTDPHEPFCIAAVHLATEQLVVLGQVVAGVGVEDLAVGQEVELVLDTLLTDGDDEQVIYKWQPVDGTATADEGGA